MKILHIRAPNAWQLGHMESNYPTSPAEVLGSTAVKSPSAGSFTSFKHEAATLKLLDSAA